MESSNGVPPDEVVLIDPEACSSHWASFITSATISNGSGSVISKFISLEQPYSISELLAFVVTNSSKENVYSPAGRLLKVNVT